MSKLIIFRHGQASFGKDNYDKLSDLGFQQSVWLGEYLANHCDTPSRVISGSLFRHQQTADGIIQGSNLPIQYRQDPAWNEFEFEGIVQSYLQKYPEARPKDKNPRAFFTLLKTAMLAWSKDELDQHQGESWGEFRTRVVNAFKVLQSVTEKETVWLISSGGVIGMLLSHIMETSNRTMVELNLQTRNTSMTEIFYKESSACLMTFNQVSHLEIAERQASITYA